MLKWLPYTITGSLVRNSYNQLHHFLDFAAPNVTSLFIKPKNISIKVIHFIIQPDLFSIYS